MRFQFANQGQWTKKAWGSFGTALIAIAFIFLQVYTNGTMDTLLITLSFIPVIIGVLQGITYMNRNQKDYIFMEEERMYIHRGTLIPEIKIEYRDINYCVAKDDHIILRLKSGKEEKINIDWLSGEDFILIREELIKRTGNEILFRAIPNKV